MMDAGIFTDRNADRYNVTPPDPKIVGPDYVQSVDTMSSSDFLKIYLETLRYQDPFNQQDLSKSLEDMVRLNQIRFFNEVKSFMEDFKAWMNQFTFMQTLSLIGKSFVFQSDLLDTLNQSEYYIVSGDFVDNVTVKIYEGEEVIKEIEMDLVKGLNKLDVSDLPRGQFTVKVFKGDTELTNWNLGYKDTVKSAGVLEGELVLDLLSGRQVPASKILYTAGGEGS